MWKTEIIFSTKSLYLYNNNNQILNISIFFTAGVHGNRSLSYYVYIFFFFPSITDLTFVLSFYHRQDFCSFLLSPTRLLFFPSITDKTFVLSFYHRQDFCSFLLSPTRLLFFPSITDKTFVLSFYHRQDFCSFLLSPTRLLLHLTI